MRSRKRHARLTRHWVALALAAASLTAAAVPGRVQAETMGSLQSQLQEIQQKKNAATNELEKVSVAAQEAEAQMRLADQELAEIDAELTGLESELIRTNDDLQAVEAELVVAQTTYDYRKGLFNTRLRAIREEGRVNYLGVLLGAHSFSDFISRFDVLRLVVKQDSTLFVQIRKDKQELEVQQAEVANKKTLLVKLQAQQQARRSVAESKRAEREVVSRSLDRRKELLRDQLAEYDRETEAVTQKVWELQQAQNRPAGAFAPVRPVRNIAITDSFGGRMHPILGTWKMHNGTDFGTPYGAPIYAIEGGVVLVAGWNDAYGNLVVIDHGGGIASWYGHSSKLLVSEGDTVVQGQQISQAGSTGWSTGPHLHLEVHVNGQPVDPMEYLP
jgi:murein DD-endopeptidase MepM/ murein hydrolase activator NlpD